MSTDGSLCMLSQSESDYAQMLSIDSSNYETVSVALHFSKTKFAQGYVSISIGAYNCSTFAYSY